MLIELPRSFERVGNALIYDTQKIYGFDSSPIPSRRAIDRYFVVKSVDYERLRSVEETMAIVIPVKNERLRLLEGVLCGLPQHCLPIIISASAHEPINRFQMECNTVDNFCQFSKRPYLMIHQTDPHLAELFTLMGYHEVVSGQGSLRMGKAEGMLAGILLAQLLGKSHIGFIDADNYFPGAVMEYVRIYSASFNMSKSPFHMSRILWHSKPKAIDSSLVFSKWGRASRHTNQVLNRLISLITGFETDIIKTGNAGEHAMSMNLATRIGIASGFAVETYNFIGIFEKFGGIQGLNLPAESLQDPIEIFQVESRNPHLHESKGSEHVRDMIHQSMSVIYHSPVTSSTLKTEITGLLRKERILKKDQEPDRPRIYPALIQYPMEKAKVIFQQDRYLHDF
ncbi:MAG: mannosyl-3-phosphoglycerate synthase [Bacteroidetes bacterium]|nr:mannosyl-3-phosphoglycerate synthase [Bacteroidota bacterium]